MRYEILKYGNPALRAKANPVGKIDAGIRQLAKAMLEAMYRSNGLGLAAEQVGRQEAICVIDVPPNRAPDGGPPVVDERGAVAAEPALPMPMVLVNPRITQASGVQVAQEGCLSFPEVFVSIKRAEQVIVVFTGLDGREQTLEAHGLLARVVQHEVDHLNGVLLVDRMSPVQKVAVSGKLRRLKQQVAA